MKTSFMSPCTVTTRLKEGCLKSPGGSISCLCIFIFNLLWKVCGAQRFADGRIGCSLGIQRGQVIPRALGNLPGPRRTAKGLIHRINWRLLRLPTGEHGELETRHVFEEPCEAERLLDVCSRGD